MNSPVKPVLDSKYVLDYRTEAAIGQCPSESQESALLSLVFSSLISKGVNKIGEFISKAGEEETKQSLAQRNVELSSDKDPVFWWLEAGFIHSH